MGLFTIGKAAFKAADSLFDDAVDVGKKVDGGFDEAKEAEIRLPPRSPERQAFFKRFDEAYPRPPGPQSDPKVTKWINKRKWAVDRYGTEGYDDLGQKIEIDVPSTPNVKGGYWDEQLWVDEHPHPIPDYDPKTATAAQNTANRKWLKLKNNAKARYITGEQKADELALREKERLGNFNEEEWLARDPVPSKGIPEAQLTPQQLAEKNAHKARKSIAIKRANKDGYDELGDAIPDPDAWDSSAWDAENPMPYPEIRQRDLDPDKLLERQAWIRRKANANPNNKASIKNTNQRTRAERLLRDMPWANNDSLFDIHRFAKDLEIDSGVKLDVDHAIAMQGNLVSGLNVPNNLQVMPKTWHVHKGNSEDEALDSLFRTDAFLHNNAVDHDLYLQDNADEVAQAIAAKQRRASGMAEQLNHQIIDPTTKVGRNAQNLWGEDYGRYVEDIRKQIGLLGV